MLVNGADDVSEKELVQYFTLQYSKLPAIICDKVACIIKDGRRVNMDTREPLIMCLDKVGASLVFYLPNGRVIRNCLIY